MLIEHELLVLADCQGRYIDSLDSTRSTPAQPKIERLNVSSFEAGADPQPHRSIQICLPYKINQGQGL